MKNEKKREIHITNNFNAPIGQHIDHVDTINFRMDGDGQFHFGSVENVNSEERKTDMRQGEEAVEGSDSQSAVSRCFRFTSEFTRQKVAEVLKTFYQGEHANLALIEVTLYDHGQLKKRNQHTAFIGSLLAWGLVDIEEGGTRQIVSGVKDKFRRLPTDGYQEWSNAYLNDKKICIDIGNKLGPTMKYQR